MGYKDKATELIDKFGGSALSQVENTIDIWTIKKNYAGDNRALEICNRTLFYWNKVKSEINQKRV